MAKRLNRWRYGTAPNYGYIWLEAGESGPDATAQIVEISDPGTIEIEQATVSNGHYWWEGVAFDAPGPAAPVTRKNIYTVPALTRGVDILASVIYSDATKAGDRFIEAKALAGKIGTAIASDSVAKTVTVRSTEGVLRPTALSGKIDEGFYVSFGTEAYSETSPLAEFMIKRIGSPISVGGGVEDVVLTLDTFPA